MLWLYLHFPHLLADHFRRYHQTHQPLVIVPPRGQRIEQVCPQAAEQGIHPGMRLQTALTLAPDLAVIQAQEGLECRVLEEQARWLYHYAAYIAPMPPDGLLAEVSSLQRLYGSLPAIWQTLEQALQARRLHATMATGHTPAAARLLARAGLGECSAERSQIIRSLERLPLSRAGLEQSTETRLRRLGLTTLGELMALPPAELAQRLSPDILTWLQKLQGGRPDPVPAWQPPHVFRQEADFIREVENSQALLFPLQRMLTGLEEDLRWRQQDTDTLHIRLRHRHGKDSQLMLRSSGPEHRAEVFLNLVRLRLEQTPLQAPVTGIVLSVRRFLERNADTGQDLLGDHRNPDEAWHELISRLRARLGEDALQRLQIQADHRPEQAWSSAPVRHRRNPAPGPGGHCPWRPLWLLPEPRPLGGVPAAWLAGPERISSGWWDSRMLQRDYYVARLHSGQMAWIFRDPDNHWFIHGCFG